MKKRQKTFAFCLLNSGGRRWIRTLDTHCAYAAFPGRYFQPLSHPSMVFSDVACQSEDEVYMKIRSCVKFFDGRMSFNDGHQDFRFLLCEWPSF